MKRLLILILFLFSHSLITAGEIISLEIQIISPETEENRSLVRNILIKSAARASRMYSDYISVEMKENLTAPDEYNLQMIAVMDGENSALVANFTDRKSGESLSQSLPGEISETSYLYLSEVIFKLWADFNLRMIRSDEPLPQFMEEVPSRYIAESVDPGFAGYNTASAVAVKENGNIVLAMGSLCYELTGDFNIVSPIGEDIFHQGSSVFVFGAAVTPGGTVYLKPVSGREIFRVIEDSPRTQRVRTGIDVTGPMAVLNNGITVLYHTMSRKFIRIEGNKRSEIDLNLGPYTYVYAMAAGPEGNIWIHDNVEQRLKIYSDKGDFINSMILVGLNGETLTPMSMTVNDNGTVLLYSNSALYKFSREGILLWKMDGYHFRENESFPITPVNISVDSENGFIYMADYASNRVLKFYDPDLNRAGPDDSTTLILDLNRKIDSDPDSADLLWEKINHYLKQESWILAKLWLEELTNINPFDEKADLLLSQIELNTLMNQVQKMKKMTMDIMDSLGPESARQKYSSTVQLFEKILSISPENREIVDDLNRFRESFNRASALPEKKDKPLTIASFSVDNIFPSLIHYYRNNPVARVSVKNELDKTVHNIRASLSLRQFIDFPLETEAVESLEPDGVVEIDLNILLNERAFNIREDLPLLAQVNITYETDEGLQSISRTAGVTLYRRTALSWDNTAKLAAFIMPNEGIVTSFSHRVLDSERDIEGIPEKITEAARICDALGTYGIRYVEDPDSPFSMISGKKQHVDTVRYPRTTLSIRSGDCDDSTALLASLLESAGISTAIMTSPGHVFLAFNTEEPAGSRWMFESESLRILEQDGTIWIPLESTVLQKGFFDVWADASSIIIRNRESDIGFVPVHSQRESFPPLPLGESNIIIVEPAAEQVDPLFGDSIKKLTDSMYVSKVSLLESQISENTGRRKRLLSNKLAILHARFSNSGEAENLFKILINENGEYLSPYINLGNLYYSNGDYNRALNIYLEAEQIKSDSVMVQLALCRTYHKLNDRSNTVKYYELVRSRSESLSDRFAYLIPDNQTARAGIEEEPALNWAIEEDQ